MFSLKLQNQAIIVMGFAVSWAGVIFRSSFNGGPKALLCFFEQSSFEIKDSKCYVDSIVAGVSSQGFFIEGIRLEGGVVELLEAQACEIKLLNCFNIFRVKRCFDRIWHWGAFSFDRLVSYQFFVFGGEQRDSQIVLVHSGSKSNLFVKRFIRAYVNLPFKNYLVAGF